MDNNDTIIEINDVSLSESSDLSQINTVDTTQLLITEYNEQIPIKNKKYFTLNSDINLSVMTNLPTISIGISFYDEDAYDFRRVLVSLADQIHELINKAECHILLVGDGFLQMSKSACEYLQLIFCKTLEDKQKWNVLMKTLGQLADNKIDKTYILQYVKCDKNTNITEQINVDIPKTLDSKDRSIKLSLLLKSCNRKKYNSQQWILSAFTPNSILSSNPNKYALLTDCGTFFASKCLFGLFNYMSTNLNCVACTGKQRIMDKNEQDCNDEKKFSIANILRKIQQIDYEMTYGIQSAAFACAGYLPVLPGPCVMIRFSEINNCREIRKIDPLENLTDNNHDNSILKESAYDHFIYLVETPPNNTDIVIENIKLAEDRILSYSIITHNNKKSYTTWVDGSIFKSQAELNLKSFLFQRRRWINGTFMCYIWNIFIRSEYILSSDKTFIRKCFIYFLLLLQLLNYLLSFLFCAIFGSTIFLSISYLSNNEQYALYILIAFHIFMMTFIWIHHFFVFVKPLFCLSIIVNISGLIVIFATTIKQFSNFYFGINNMFQFIAIAIFMLPFIVSLITLSYESFVIIFYAFIPYILFIPSLVGTFTMYACARLHDTTWGNRESSDTTIMGVKSEINSNSSVILLLISICNIILQIIIYFFRNNSMFLLCITAIIIVPVIIQLFFAIVYFLLKHITLKTYYQRYHI